MNRFTLRRLYFWLAIAGWSVAGLLYATGIAHADPYCGPNSNYDWRHDTCGAGAPVPGGNGVYPYPMPGQEGPSQSGNLPGYGR